MRPGRGSAQQWPPGGSDDEQPTGAQDAPRSRSSCAVAPGTGLTEAGPLALAPRSRRKGPRGSTSLWVPTGAPFRPAAEGSPCAQSGSQAAPRPRPVPTLHQARRELAGAGRGQGPTDPDLGVRARAGRGTARRDRKWWWPWQHGRGDLAPRMRRLWSMKCKSCQAAPGAQAVSACTATRAPQAGGQLSAGTHEHRRDGPRRGDGARHGHGMLRAARGLTSSGCCLEPQNFAQRHGETRGRKEDRARRWEHQ